MPIPPPGTDPHRPVSSPAPVPSAVLLGPDKRLDIEHRGERYTLRVTRNGKLILTK